MLVGRLWGPGGRDPPAWPLLAYLLSCCIYPLASSCAHTFSPMSARARHVCYFFDYAALSMYSLGEDGGVHPGIRNLQGIYSVGMGGLGLQPCSTAGPKAGEMGFGIWRAPVGQRAAPHHVLPSSSRFGPGLFSICVPRRVGW